MNAHRVRTASVILGAVLLVLGTIWASFVIVAVPSQAALNSSCPSTSADYCYTTFSADSVSTDLGSLTDAAKIINDNPNDSGIWALGASPARTTLTGGFASLDSYLVGAIPASARLFYCWKTSGSTAFTGLVAKLGDDTLSGMVASDAGTGPSIPCRVSSWVAYSGSAVSYSLSLSAVDNPASANNTYISYIALQVTYQIPPTPVPTVTATVTPPTVTETATETWYAYRSEVPVPSGTVAASLIPAVMADLRDVNIDDSDMAVLSRPPFVDEFFPAIITGVIMIVLVLSVTMWSAWGRRG